MSEAKDFGAKFVDVLAISLVKPVNATYRARE